MKSKIFEVLYCNLHCYLFAEPGEVEDVTLTCIAVNDSNQCVVQWEVRYSNFVLSYVHQHTRCTLYCTCDMKT